MKKYFLFIILFLIAQILYAEVQLSYDFTYDESEGVSHRIASYITTLSQSWLIENITNGSFHPEADKEKQNDDTQYYLLNYIRNKIIASHFSDNYIISAYLSGEYDFGKNIKTNIAGLPYQYTLQHGLYPGFRANYTYSNLETDLSVDYDSKKFRYETADSTEEYYTEANVQGRIKTSLSLSNPLKAYFEAYHYNDLNESSQFDYSQLFAGLSFDKKLNHIHYLSMDVAGGYSDIDSLFPYTFRSEARLTSKFIHNWMMVTKLSYDVWANKEIDGIYVGKHFAELLVQKNFSFTPNNEVSKLQLSAAHYFLNNYTLLKTKLEFYIKKMMFSISYRRYIGKNSPYDNKFIGKICYPIFSNVRLSYSYHFQDNHVIPEVNAHSCGIDVFF